MNLVIDNTSDDKRIALNTVVLYIKLVITTIVGLICSRYILRYLGVDDYGLYSVVGGIVSFINIIGITMVSVSYRYLAIEIGKGESGNPNKIYNSVLFIHIILALILILVGETIGVFYINNYLNVAAEKIPDALFVFHVSLLTTGLSIINVPANGLIIAREKFLYTSITEIGISVIKLALVILLGVYLGNRLRLFAIIMAFITFITFLSYQLYCIIKDRIIIKWKFNKTFQDYKEIIAFAWWSLFGALAVVGKENGAAIIINYFFGTALNAAFGLATQVNRYVLMFTNSLNQAAVPQIMKSYGAGREERTLDIVYSITRLSTLILLMVIIPLSLCLEDILKLWLGEVPEYTSVFVMFMLINGLVGILGSGFDPCIQATGKIRENEIGYGLINLALLPIIFVLYYFGFPPYINVIVVPFLTLATRAFQIYIMRKNVDFSFRSYWQGSLAPCLKTALALIIPVIPLRIIMGHTFLETTIVLITSFVITIISIWIFGLKDNEKKSIIRYVKMIKE